MNRSFPIVGAFYRPPAKALVSSLPLGTELLVRSDPYGEVVGSPHNDPSALAVFLPVTEKLERELTNDEGQLTAIGRNMEEMLGGYGFCVAEILHEKEWCLGYIPRKDAEMILTPSGDLPATFLMGSQGGPRVNFDPGS